MGSFLVTISGTGGHGCSRDVKDGGHVLGCQRPDCPDCIAREFVRRYKRNGVSELRAELVHWPRDYPGFKLAVEDGGVKLHGDLDLAAIDDLDVHIAARYALVLPQGSTVIDDLVTGRRTGSF